jgi:hypothetical protein
MKVLPIALLAMLAGFGDAFGFIHAPGVWAQHGVCASALARTLAGFLVGALGYLVLVRVLKSADIRTPEVQTMIWFAAASVGVGAASGRAFHWPLADKLVGLIVIAGVAWLSVRVQ